jgi:hypothetical protein
MLKKSEEKLMAIENAVLGPAFQRFCPVQVRDECAAQEEPGKPPAEEQHYAGPSWNRDSGLFVRNSGGAIRVTTDNFGTVPAVFDLSSQRLCPDFETLDPLNIAERDLDRVGFWEAMLYDMPLLTRTLNKHVLQIPGGSHFDYNLADNQWHTKRWNYFNGAAPLASEESLLRAINRRLGELARSYWENLPGTHQILLPLSGGLDSRLLAVHLARSGDPARIQAITFGFSERSLEYRLAAQVCKSLGIRVHRFHRLDPSYYAGCLADFWNLWQGCISVLHAHLYSFLKLERPTNVLLVSGFMADPIAGYCAQARSEWPVSVEGTTAFRVLEARKRELKLPCEIGNAIFRDLENIFQESRECNDVMGFDEFMYFTQRQSKTFPIASDVCENLPCCDTVCGRRTRTIVHLRSVCPPLKKGDHEETDRSTKRVPRIPW